MKRQVEPWQIIVAVLLLLVLLTVAVACGFGCKKAEAPDETTPTPEQIEDQLGKSGQRADAPPTNGGSR